VRSRIGNAVQLTDAVGRGGLPARYWAVVVLSVPVSGTIGGLSFFGYQK
jgi:hypothetical protein